MSTKSEDARTGGESPHRGGSETSRRRWLAMCAGGAAGASLAPGQSLAFGDPGFLDEEDATGKKPETALALEDYRVRKGRIRQSVVAWCFGMWDVETLARYAKALGMESVELVPPEHWPILRRHGLECAITPTHGFRIGWNHREHHAECAAIVAKRIDETADAGWGRVITFSGMRGDLDDAQGIRNTVEGLKTVVGRAEKRGVDICLEMLNTRDGTHPMKGHPGYHCDRLEWAKQVCEEVASPRIKILFDIYHVQIMHGDVIRRIRELKDLIGHYHTAGVPGRGELDDSQEINYPPILRAIVETGYRGFVGQEFIPTRDPLKSLAEAVRLCDV
jgi:hydroxypyruvate isomerase